MYFYIQKYGIYIFSQVRSIYANQTILMADKQITEDEVKKKLEHVTNVLNSVFPGSETSYEQVEDLVTRLEGVARVHLLKGAENEVNLKL